MLTRQIFRKVSLDRLSSPERLDQALSITTPRTWLALMALIALLAVGLAWGFLGRVSTKTSGTGVVIYPGGTYVVTSLSGGQVERVLVHSGQWVKAGQVVATLTQPELSYKVEMASNNLAGRQTDAAGLLRLTAQTAQLQLSALKAQRAAINDQIPHLELRVSTLDGELKVDQQLLAKGLIPARDILADKQSIESAKDALHDTQVRLRTISASEQALRQGLKESELRQHNSLQQLQQNVSDLEKQYSLSTRVVSPYSGQVLDSLVDPGNLIAAGSGVVSLQAPEGTLIAVVFVSAEQAKEIAPGMAVQVSPTVVKREEYGFMLGKVTSVAVFPSTPVALMRLLENQPLVQYLSSSGLPVEVKVELELDPVTPSGYRWSSQPGPFLQLSSGTIVTAQIIVREQRPISLVMPFLRKQLGLD